jgi:hypothetical protein
MPSNLLEHPTRSQRNSLRRSDQNSHGPGSHQTGQGNRTSSKVFKSKALDTDDKFSFTFATPGVYDYFCSMHPHMTGEIVVESGKVSATGSVRADVGR